MMRVTLENSEFVQNLKKIDHWLLVNRPRLWVIRLPYLALYTLAANLGVYLIIQALPLQLHHAGYFFPILWVVFLAALGAFIFWLTRFNRHSAARPFENTSAFKGLGDFLIYLGCILALLSPSITASFSLTGRFDGMISLAEVREDVRIGAVLRSGIVYPDEFAQKYTGLDAEARKGMSNGEINWTIGYNLPQLAAIKENDFEELWAFFTLHLIVSHFALVMFATKHVKRSTVYRTIAYGVGLFILLISCTLFFIENYVWPWGYLFVLGIIALITASVFRLKRYREFVAMNIALLPVGVSFCFTIAIMVYIYDHEIYQNLSSIEETQLKLLIFSPLLYLWLIPVLKAMYMQLLSLPREG